MISDAFKQQVLDHNRNVRKNSSNPPLQANMQALDIEDEEQVESLDTGPPDTTEKNHHPHSWLW